MNYWLVKSEPTTYSWEQLVKDKKSVWDGVRNYAARLNLIAMQKGDLAFFYHSNIGLEIVGVVEITKEHFQDPSTDDERWVAVEIKPVKKLNNSVPLSVMKADKKLENFQLIKISRLSVCVTTKAEFEHILKLSETKL